MTQSGVVADVVMTPMIRWCTLSPTQAMPRFVQDRASASSGEPINMAAGSPSSIARQTREPGWVYSCAQRIFALVPAQAFVAQWLASFKDFPPRQKLASFSIDQVMDKLNEAPGREPP